MARILTFAAFALALMVTPLHSQDEAQKPNARSAPNSPSMSGHDMPDHPAAHPDMPGMDMPSGPDSLAADRDDSAHAIEAMEGQTMDMGPHMKMTSLRRARPGDQERANQVVEAARRAAEKYKDYRVALADGFKIFLPNVPQKQYHFTNYRYAFEAAFWFSPDHPTSLLYEKNADGYTLIGVMYTAPKKASEEELDKRIPLSVAQWHAHINLCLPPDDQKRELWGPSPKFGLAGSISTKEGCDDAGGKFIPQVFGWMVHVYPFEQKAADIWSVGRQMPGGNHVD
jgi:hypothetical protein